jgi:hypothetical protein
VVRKTADVADADPGGDRVEVGAGGDHLAGVDPFD